MKLNRGIITLVFDDGYQHIYQQVVPILARYNIPAVFALPLDTDQAQSSAPASLKPWPQWLHLKEKGHEIAAHGIIHADLTRLADHELEQELAQPKAELAATTLVYPGGAVDDRVAHAAQSHYSAARTTKHGFEQIPPRDPMQLKTYNFTRHNFSVTKANLLALYAILTNSWLIETYHIVDDHETQAVHAVKLTQLAKHIKFLTKLPVAIRTINSTLRSS